VRLSALVLAVVLLAAGCTGAVSQADDVAAPPAELSGVDFDATGWRTDFSTHGVPLEQFHSGGPPRDGIPPIDEPAFVEIGEEPIDDREPVIVVAAGDEARAYPLQILTWHEIVNDEIDGLEIAVTFCPLCNASIVFERVLDGRELTFGTTGNLRFSDLVMWDRQTESWWQQFSGEALVGELTGARLNVVPSQMVSFGEFRERFPDGRVLSRDTGFDRPYGSNPYAGYDDVDTEPFLLRDVDEIDGRLAPKARVVAVTHREEFVAYPLGRVREREVVNDTVGGRPVVVWWRPGAASALDRSRIRDGRQVGSALVYDRRADGRVLSFTPGPADAMVDRQTGSRWSADGVATSGPLRGARLRPVASDTPFWFAVAAFRPDARVYGG
jgi:hypothetical protein